MKSANEKSKTQPIDVTIIYQMMRDMRQELLDSIRETKRSITDLSGRIAIAQKDVIALTSTMGTIVKDAADSRVARLQQDLADQEREKKVLEERIRIVDEKIDEKKVAKIGALDTTGRMKIAAELTYEEREKLEKSAKDALMEKRKESIITAVLISTSVGAVGAVISAITWFVIFYINNR